jgi:hypothetical protein
MNPRNAKEQHMKMRALFTPAALLLVAAMAGGAPAWAADTLVPIAGIVSGDGESVSFSGQAQISSRIATDPDFGRPSLLLTIDLSGVSGVGSATSAKYVVRSLENVQRRVAASHRVEVTFPFTKGNDAGQLNAARSGVASFTLNFNPATGAVTSATGNVSSPAF